MYCYVTCIQVCFFFSSVGMCMCVFMCACTVPHGIMSRVGKTIAQKRSGWCQLIAFSGSQMAW